MTLLLRLSEVGPRQDASIVQPTWIAASNDRVSSAYPTVTDSWWSPGGNGRTITNMPTDAIIAGPGGVLSLKHGGTTIAQSPLS